MSVSIFYFYCLNLFDEAEDNMKTFEHSAARAMNTLFFKSSLSMATLHLAFEDMEFTYRDIGKDAGTEDPRVKEIASVLCKLKVLSFSWGKIYGDEVCPSLLLALFNSSNSKSTSIRRQLRILIQWSTLLRP